MRGLHTPGLESRFDLLAVPAIRGLEYYGECRRAAAPPAHAGGDFFEWMPLSAERLAISLGELSGHGNEAAVLISGVQASLRGFAHNGRGKLSGIVQGLNKVICELSPENWYATLFYATVDPVARELRYVSAGHEPVLLIRRNPSRVRHLESTGAVLGLTRRTEYRQRTLLLEPGDLLVGFTGGVAGAMDPSGSEFGEIGVLQVVNSFPDARPADLAAEILEAAARFTRSAPAADDRTVVVLRFNDLQAESAWTASANELQFTAA